MDMSIISQIVLYWSLVTIHLPFRKSNILFHAAVDLDFIEPELKMISRFLVETFENLKTT